MNILHTEASCGWGGQEIRILEEARGLMARGHRLTLWCPPQSSIAREAGRYGVSVRTLPIARKGLAGFRAMRAALATAQRHDRIDVINSHSSTDSWLVALALTWLANAPPLVRTRHVSAPVPNNAATRWLYGRATRLVVTTGAALREGLIRDI